jgi:SAM-dependent methyltransferase
LSKQDLIETRCAICNTTNNSTEIYPANYNLQLLNPIVYSARRLPDRVHFRLVKCNHCGLVRSDPIVSSEFLNILYQRSSFTYSDEIINLRKTYGRSLAEILSYGAQKGRLLEIGCGNGFFLEEALAQGYLQVIGVEPSLKAVANASPTIFPRIRCTMMHPGLFEREQMDVICMFQVLDHLIDPGSVIEECYKLLKPGGIILCINHNIDSWTSKIMKEHSPIIDIEHTYLYSPSTLSKLFMLHGFTIKQVGSISNQYSIYYLMRLLPIPILLKRHLLDFLEGQSLRHYSVSIPLGNIRIIAQKSPC